jgi:hypothetical protein
VSLTVSLPPYVRDLRGELVDAYRSREAAGAAVITVQTSKGLAWLTVDPMTARSLVAHLTAAGFGPVVPENP